MRSGSRIRRTVGSSPILAGPPGAEDHLMAEPARTQTYDDELHERRRHLAIVRSPIDFEARRLERLIEKSRDTRDP